MRNREAVPDPQGSHFKLGVVQSVEEKLYFTNMMGMSTPSWKPLEI